MKTYNTYQEAKIANPESEIASNGTCFAATEQLKVGDSFKWRVYNPADYCMTVERFLADGHKFVDGDIFMNHLGELKSVGRIIKGNNYTPDEASSPDKYDDNCFILRAAALEQTETPEEKEAFDVMAQDNEAAEKWSVGDKCVVNNKGDRFSVVDGCCHLMGQEATVIHTFKNSNDYNMALVEFQDGGCFAFVLEMLSKPKTEREAFIDEGLKISNEINPYTLGKMFDSGKFKLV